MIMDTREHVTQKYTRANGWVGHGLLQARKLHEVNGHTSWPRSAPCAASKSLEIVHHAHSQQPSAPHPLVPHNPMPRKYEADCEVI